MNGKFGLLISIGILILVSACASGNQVASSEDTRLQITEQGKEGIQLQYEGKGPIEITPNPFPAPDENSSGSSADQGGGNVNPASGGVQSETLSEGSGQIQSYAPSVLVANEGNIEPTEWLSYQDQEYSFSISYPDTYTILPQGLGAEDQDPIVLHHVRFEDKALATGDTASFEIPKFTIQIYELGDQTMETFLDIYAVSAEREVYNLGDLTGWRVEFNRLSAPNEFYYFSSQGHVYKLTPLGEHGMEMLNSFEIIN